MTRLDCTFKQWGLEMRLRIYQIIITTSKTQVTWLLFFPDRVIKVSQPAGCLIYKGTGILRSSHYCPRLKLSQSCLRDMKERREVEKARKNVLFFSSFILLHPASLVNYLNARNGLFHVCYWSLYSNLNMPINFRAGHSRKNTIQFAALTKRFSYQLNWNAISSHLKRLPGKQLPLTDSMRIRRFHAYWSIFILKYFLKTCASPLLKTNSRPYYYQLLQNPKLFLYRSHLLIFHTSGSKNTIC